jgi:membrane dipeptidase
MSPRFVFDAHVDTLQLALELDVDLGRSSPGQLDLPRAREGGLGAVVFACWVHPLFLAPERGGARARADALFDRFDDLGRRHPQDVCLVRGRGDLRSACADGRLAAIAGIEGGHPLEESLAGLEHFFARGLRVLTLVWNNHLTWIRSCEPGAGPEVPAGLSDFGRQVVGRLNELGVLIDLSHSSPTAFFEALEVSTRPVIASHSGCRALHDHQRNLTDEQLRALAEAGGVVGLPFLPSFLDGEAQARAARLRESPAYRALRAPSAAGLELERTRFMACELAPLSIERLVDHIEHALRVAGSDHVGLGSDFDGITTTVQGLEDAVGYPRLEEALRRRGFGERAVAKVLGENLLRVFDEVLPE